MFTTLTAWGTNYFSQLGDGTYGNKRTTPVEVSNLDGAELKALAAGQGHSLALKDDGTVLAWGYNNSGQLGNGTNANSTAPVQVEDPNDSSGYLTSVNAIAAGSSHGLALKNDGTVWAWGDNQLGQLGNGTNANSSTPVQVSDLDGVKAIAADFIFSLALKNDGTVWAWGSNQFGQLGDGTTTNGTPTTCVPMEVRPIVRSSCTDSNTPVQMSEVGGVEAIAAGGAHGLALKDDGTVWAWGFNQDGQLGNGTTTLGTNVMGINAPMQVSGLVGAKKAIAAGSNHSLAGG